MRPHALACEGQRQLVGLHVEARYGSAVGDFSPAGSSGFDNPGGVSTSRSKGCQKIL